MKQRCKRVVAFFSALVMGLVLIGSTPLTAMADTTDEQLNARNEAYRTLLESELNYENRLSVVFNLVDIDNDGSEDLIITKTLAGDSNGYDMTSTEVYSWKNEQIGNESCGTGEHNKLFYATGTDGNRYLMSEDFSPATGNKYNVSMYDYQIWKAFALYGMGSDYGISGKNYMAFIMNESKDTYIKGSENWTIVNCDETESVQYENWLSTYMPNPVEVKGIYEVTEENLNKYLPLTEDVTIEVTTNAITLKVGEAFGLSVENIDKLLKETGYEYTHDSSSFPWIFYGDRVVMDAEYLARTAGVDIYDVNAQKVLDRMYVADEEWAEVIEKDESGYYTEKYGVEEVWLVEEAEGMFFYARADEVGTTTITIPEYPVAGGGTITVNIPVVIQQVADIAVDVVDVVIESTTDNTITIKSDKDILSANVKLTSAKLESGEVYTNAEKLVKGKVSNIGNYAVYELNITDENGVEVHQLTGKVHVTMNVPFTMAENSTIKVYRVDNDTLIECPATVSNGKVTFETDHFSTYIFAEATQVTAPKTGDNSSTVTFVLLMIAGVSLCGVAVFRKKVN